MRKSIKYLVMLSMFMLSVSSVFAEHFKLFVHGRSSENHCQAIVSTASATTDYNNAWGGAVTGLTNVRYIGFDGTKNGGAYSWENCGAQKQFHDALRIFCQSGNSCEIYTHSTGGLVAAAYFGLNTPSALSITRIQLMASAAGGSELADISTDYLAWLGVDSLGGELDESVSTSGARNGFNHYNAGGRTYYTTSGEGTDSLYITAPFLPGKDDGVLANHSLCSVNAVSSVGISCTRGSAALSEPYACGFLWLSTCYKTHSRWTPYYQVFIGGGDHSHGDSKKDYNYR
jgi:hypothetical protein